MIIRPAEEVFTIFGAENMHNFTILGRAKIGHFLEETVKSSTAWNSKTKYHNHCEMATSQPDIYLIEDQPESVSFKV